MLRAHEKTKWKPRARTRYYESVVNNGFGITDISATLFSTKVFQNLIKTQY